MTDIEELFEASQDGDLNNLKINRTGDKCK